ncbi:MAG: hypothetical protein JRJ68_10120 [Deltaproteobacteria bacterium]|nr:hypothetical protein [Deltaproteobacteria bacterium]
MTVAKTIIQSYSAMGYDAIAVSASDLTAGKDFFESSAENHYPWTSVNIFDSSGKALFKPYIVKDIGGLTVGVVGITGQSSQNSQWAVIKDWQGPLRRQLQDLESLADIVVLLSNLPSSDIHSIVQLFPQIDLIITADRKRGNLSPSISGNSLISQTGARGKYLGQLSIKFRKSGRWYSDNSRKIEVIEDRIKSVDNQIGKLQKQNDKQGNTAGRIKKLITVKSDLEQNLATEKSSRINSSNQITNSFKANFIPIRPNY